MPRNQSEQTPFPDIPMDFHERVAAWEEAKLLSRLHAKLRQRARMGNGHIPQDLVDANVAARRRWQGIEDAMKRSGRGEDYWQAMHLSGDQLYLHYREVARQRFAHFIEAADAAQSK